MNFGDGGCAASYTYSHSRGLYAGISLEGSVIFSRSDVNHRFYGRVVTPTDLLRGNIPPPRAAQPLYDALGTALSAFTQPTYSCFTNPQISPLPASGQSSGKYGSQGPGSANLNFGLHGSSESGSAKSIEYFGVTARNEESFSTFDSTSSVPLSALSSQQSNRTFFSTDRRTR